MKTCFHFFLWLTLICSACTQPKNYTNEFFILGTLDDYMGRRLDPRYKNQIEQYHESDAILMAAIDSIVKVTYPQSVYQRIKWEGNTLKSEAIAQKLNSYYNFQKSTDFTPQGEPILEGTLKAAIFKNEQAKLAFIAGAFIRFGSIENKQYVIRMGNSASKMQALQSLLADLGCNPKLEIIPNIPKIARLTFSPTPKLTTYLNSYEPLRKEIALSREHYIQERLRKNRSRNNNKRELRNKK